MVESSVNYTVKELLKSLHDKIDIQAENNKSILAQVTKTNGRVTKLESNPFTVLGNKIQNKPFKFIIGSSLFLIFSLTLIIGDFRKPLLDLLIKYFTKS